MSPTSGLGVRGQGWGQDHGQDQGQDQRLGYGYCTPLERNSPLHTMASQRQQIIDHNVRNGPFWRILPGSSSACAPYQEDPGDEVGDPTQYFANSILYNIKNQFKSDLLFFMPFSKYREILNFQRLIPVKITELFYFRFCNRKTIILVCLTHLQKRQTHTGCIKCTVEKLGIFWHLYTTNCLVL